MTYAVANFLLVGDSNLVQGFFVQFFEIIIAFGPLLLLRAAPYDQGWTSIFRRYLGLDEAIIDYVCEIAGSLKIGKCMPGTSIPVVEESRLFSDQPDCAVIFSWHIADELAPKLRAKGYRGKLVTPLPVPREL